MPAVTVKKNFGFHNNLIEHLPISIQVLLFPSSKLCAERRFDHVTPLSNVDEVTRQQWELLSLEAELVMMFEGLCGCERQHYELLKLSAIRPSIASTAQQASVDLDKWAFAVARQPVCVFRRQRLIVISLTLNCNKQALPMISGEFDDRAARKVQEAKFGKFRPRPSRRVAIGC